MMPSDKSNRADARAIPRSWIVLLTLALVSLCPVSSAHEPELVHRRLTSAAFPLLPIAYCQPADLMAVTTGSRDEDYQLPFPFPHESGLGSWIQHFYNPRTGEGYVNSMTARDSAVEHWQWAIDAHQASPSNDEYNGPYHLLGQVLHLLQDMSVPAHVHLDPHPNEDDFENWGVTHINDFTDFSGLTPYVPGSRDIGVFMYDLATFTYNLTKFQGELWESTDQPDSELRRMFPRLYYDFDTLAWKIPDVGTYREFVPLWDNDWWECDGDPGFFYIENTENACPYVFERPLAHTSFTFGMTLPELYGKELYPEAARYCAGVLQVFAEQVDDGNDPQVVSHQTSLAPSGNVYAIFSEQMDAATFTTASVTVIGSSSGTHSCVFDCDCESHELKIDPSSDFALGETINVTIGTGVKDLIGNGLAATYAFDFEIQSDVRPNIVVPLYEPDVIDPHSQVSGCHSPGGYGSTPPLALGLHLFTDFDGNAGAILSYSTDSCRVEYDDWLRIDFDAPYFRSDPNDPSTAYHPNPGKIYILAAAVNAFCQMGSSTDRVFGRLKLEFDDRTTADWTDIPELELTAGYLPGDDLVNWVFTSGQWCYISAVHSEYSRQYTHGNFGLVLVTIPIPNAYQNKQLKAITVRSSKSNTSVPNVHRALKVMGITVREPQPYLEFKVEVPADPIDRPPASFGLYDNGGTLLRSWAGVLSGRDVQKLGEQVLNNPRFQYWADLGPIPEGVYTVGKAGPTGSKPAVKWYPLTPKPGTWTWGRSGFYIHPGTVSHGCIVLSPSDYGGYDATPPLGTFRGDFEDTPGAKHAIENGFMELRVTYDIPNPPYHSPPVAASAVGVGLHSGADLLVTVEETGHGCGYFGPTGEAFCNIDGAEYSGPDAEPQMVTMRNLADTSQAYRIDLFPRYAGEYELGITYWPLFGSPTSCLDSGDTMPGLAGRYTAGAAPHTCSLVEVAPGDFNEDGNVDSADYLEFQKCVAGPGGVYLDGCADGDLNSDGDVDLHDFRIFAINFSASQ